MEKFRQLGLSPELIKVLAESGFTEPTEIQEKTIPLALAGKDIIGGSATGSGKTLAFGASIIDKLERKRGVQALVITPTRELAQQVGKALKSFSRYNYLDIAIVYGGVAIGPQVDDLVRADVLVGTPGRILDHLERGTLKLGNVKTLVLDEADRMLDMGFIDDVNRIISQCPRERQTFLFSATISPDISHIAKKFMKHPVEVSVDSYVDPSKLRQEYYDVPQEQKFSLLVHLLKEEKRGLVMVFCNTRHNTDFIARNLQNNEIEAIAIHGGLTQARRNKIMEHFHQGRVFILVCTDVAARGLDIKGVSHVYNYDSPPTSKDYIHRIGRTARAGKEGIAVSIVSVRDYENFRSVLRDQDLHIELKPLPEINSAKIRIFGREGRGRDDRGRDNRGRDNRGFGQRSFGGRGGGRGGSGRSYGQRSSGGYGERSSGRSFGGRERSSGSRDDRRSGGRSSGRSFGGRSEGRRSYGRSTGRSFGQRSHGFGSRH